MNTGTVIPLWNGNYPDSQEPCASSLTAFYPERAAARPVPAVVLIPGGAYAFCSCENEGDDFARWFNLRGCAAFVLRYRTAPEWKHPAMLQDGMRAIRLVREHAERWNLDPLKIGAMGSSAGGHLLATILTLGTNGNPEAEDPVERRSAIPDFAVFCYPVITLGKETHLDTRNNVCGTNSPSQDMIDRLSCERHVPPNAPPCFLWHMEMDGTVPMENSLLFAAALHRQGVPVSLHVYPHEGHGLGLGGSRTPPFSDALPWTKELDLWLKENEISVSETEF